jgi:hypothetical protein
MSSDDIRQLFDRRRAEAGVDVSSHALGLGLVARALPKIVSGAWTSVILGWRSRSGVTAVNPSGVLAHCALWHRACRLSTEVEFLTNDVSLVRARHRL